MGNLGRLAAWRTAGNRALPLLAHAGRISRAAGTRGRHDAEPDPQRFQATAARAGRRAAAFAGRLALCVLWRRGDDSQPVRRLPERCGRGGAGQSLRHHRDHGACHRARIGPGRRAVVAQPCGPALAGLPRLPARRRRASGAAGRAGRNSRGRGGRGARLPQSPRARPRAFHRGPVPARRAALSQRRPRALRRARRAGLSGPHRRPGQDPRFPHRAGRSGGDAGPASGRRRGSGHGRRRDHRRPRPIGGFCGGARFGARVRFRAAGLACPAPAAARGAGACGRDGRDSADEQRQAGSPQAGRRAGGGRRRGASAHSAAQRGGAGAGRCVRVRAQTLAYRRYRQLFRAGRRLHPEHSDPVRRAQGQHRFFAGRFDALADHRAARAARPAGGLGAAGRERAAARCRPRGRLSAQRNADGDARQRDAARPGLGLPQRQRPASGSAIRRCRARGGAPRRL